VALPFVSVRTACAFKDAEKEYGPKNRVYCYTLATFRREERFVPGREEERFVQAGAAEEVSARGGDLVSLLVAATATAAAAATSPARSVPPGEESCVICLGSRLEALSARAKWRRRRRWRWRRRGGWSCFGCIRR
jgi:hypothetical protein